MFTKGLIFFLLSVNLFAADFKLLNELIFKIDLKQQYKHGNVIQGIANIDNKWVISQTNANKKLIITFLDTNGFILKNKVLNYPSHGQDLSIKYISKNSFYLLTSSKNNMGVSIFKVDTSKTQKISFYKDIKLSYGFNTPAISKDSHYIVIKNYNQINIYLYKDLINNKDKRPLYSFLLDEIQQNKNEWFQGIAMKDGYIYCLSGNNKLNSLKHLIIYDSYGSVTKNYILNTGKDYALKEGSKWELEGLTIKKNSLYTTVMTGKNGKNIKRLYKILDISNDK
jgi:hypothetical protein